MTFPAPSRALKFAALAVLCGWAVGLAHGAAGDSPFIIEHFDKGLPQGSILAMTQTRDGYLWVGTGKGLARFDGIQFTPFDPDDTMGLKNSKIVKLFEDSRTNLWVGTEADGIVLITRLGTVTNLAKIEAITNGCLKAACEDLNGTVWFHTADTGTEDLTGRLVCRYRDGRTMGWQVQQFVKNHKGELAPVSESKGRFLIAEGPGLLWVGTDWSQMALHPAAKTAPGQSPPADKVFYIEKLDYLLSARNGGYWRLFGGATGQIARCVTKLGQTEARKFADYPWIQKTAPVTCACGRSRGNLIVGTFGSGLYWFDAEGHYQHISTEDGLSHSSVMSLCVDLEGCLWVGTNGRGLDRVRRKVFDLLRMTQGKTVQSACGDGQSGLWVGYNDQQVDHWNGGLPERSNLHSPRELPNLSLVFVPTALGVELAKTVRAVFVDRDRNVWIGTQNYGLLRLENGRFTNAPGSERIPRQILALHQDRQGVLWVGTKGGLARWDGRDWS